MTKRFSLKPSDSIRCDLFDGGIDIAEVHRDDAQGLCSLLNELAEENEELKQTIKEAYKTERTAIGKSVLKQLLEAIQ